MLIHEYDIKYSRGNLLHLTYHIWHAIIILLHYTALKFRLSISETISINLENQQQQWIYIYIYIYVTNLLALYNSGDLRQIPLTMISNKINPSKKVNENLHKLLKWKKIEKKEQMWKKKCYDTVCTLNDDTLFCNFPFNCRILASTLAVKPILVSCRARDRSRFHMCWSSTSFL